MSSAPVFNDRRVSASDDEDTEITIPNEPYHDQEERPEHSEGEEEQRLHSYEPSVVSTSSNPPPYELYPPAKTVFGRIYNWLRKIPSLNTHQAIYLPTIRNDSSGRSIFSIRRRQRRDSSSSISSANSVSCWSYSYFAITDRLPDCPRFLVKWM